MYVGYNSKILYVEVIFDSPLFAAVNRHEIVLFSK